MSSCTPRCYEVTLTANPGASGIYTLRKLATENVWFGPNGKVVTDNTLRSQLVAFVDANPDSEINSCSSGGVLRPYGVERTGTAVYQLPDRYVKSFTLVKEIAGGRVEVSFDGGTSWDYALNNRGSRSWGNSDNVLDTQQVRFRGGTATTRYEVHWEV